MTLPARLSVVVLTAFILSFPGTLYAQTKNSLRVNPTRKAVLEEQMVKRSERIKTVVMRLVERFENRLKNYEEFLERVRTRRDKLADKGKSMTKIDAYIVTAEKNLKSAQTTVAAARVTLDSLDYTAGKSEVRNAVTTEVKKVKEAMVTLHTSMAQTVKQLKADDALKPTKAAGVEE